MDSGIVTIIGSIIAACATVAVAVITKRSKAEAEADRAAQAEYRKKRETQEIEQRAADLNMATVRDKVIATSGNLSLVTSLAVTGGVINGNVETAREQYMTALAALDATQAELAQKYLHLKG